MPKSDLPFFLVLTALLLNLNLTVVCQENVKTAAQSRATVTERIIKINYYTAPEVAITKVSSIYPFTLYAEKIVEKYVHTKTYPCSILQQKMIVINPEKIISTQYPSGEDIVNIFILPGCKQIRAKAGSFSRENGDMVNFIFVPENYEKGMLLHELSHVLFELGDEYGGEPVRWSSTKELRYKNISTKKYVHQWEEIKEITKDNLVGYYEGGLGVDYGVYHPYPDCLMSNLNSKLCPVCFFYAINALNKLTGKDIDFITAYHIYKEEKYGR